MFLIETLRQRRQEKYCRIERTRFEKIIRKFKFYDLDDISAAKWERRADITGLVVLGFALGVAFMLILAYMYAPPFQTIDLTVF